MPQVIRYQRTEPPRAEKTTKRTKRFRFVAFAAFLLGFFFVFHGTHGHALADTSQVKSGVSNFCLDDQHDSKLAGAIVEAWPCNDSAAQNWTVTGSSILHDDTTCLSVAANGKVASDKIVSNICNSGPGQVWLRDNGGYMNPNSGLCLNLPSDKAGTQLALGSCASLSQASELWNPTEANHTITAASCGNTEGQRIACAAEQQWTIWQSGTPNHEALLNTYTDGAPYEAWCADFVSYIYKQAGYSFTQGEADGWDENIASNIQNMGFTLHTADGYTPKTGDVAFFDYVGGHVEIVVSGGKTPTFVYGNSATIDPTTGNGQMEANTITSDGSAGNVVYYLSPNTGN